MKTVQDLAQQSLVDFRMFNEHAEQILRVGDDEVPTRSAWSTQAVAERLGLPKTSYEDREPQETRRLVPRKKNAKKKDPAAMTVDFLASVAQALGTFPSVLLLPSVEVSRGEESVRLQATKNATSSVEVPLQQYCLWVLGLAPLPGQHDVLLDARSRYLKWSPDIETPTVQSIRAEAGAWIESAPVWQRWRDKAVTQGWEAIKSLNDPSGQERRLTTADDVTLGLQVLSACRQVIRLVAMSMQSSDPDNDPEVQALQEVAREMIDILGSLLWELGERSGRAQAPSN